MLKRITRVKKQYLKPFTNEKIKLSALDSNIWNHLNMGEQMNPLKIFVYKLFVYESYIYLISMYK